MNDTQTLKESTEFLKKAAKEVYDFIGAIADELTFVESDRFISKDGGISGAVCGFIEIDGYDAAIFAVNPKIDKGGIGKAAADKIEKVIDNAVKTGIPVIGVLNTAGAKLSEGIAALEGYGRIFKSLSSAYAEVPVIIVNKGDNFGLSSFFTGLCDICIGYEKSVMATSSPLILAAKSNLDASKTGTSLIHSESSGMYSLTVKTDAELKGALKKVLGFFNKRIVQTDDDENRTAKTLKAFSAPEAYIKEIFDKDTFFEIRKDFAKEVITGFARLGGVSAVIVANNPNINGGRITASAAVKISEILYIAEAFSLPVINLVDSSGTITDIDQENSSLIREVSALISAYCRLDAPKIALITGTASGAGYAVFASKGAMDYCLAYENSVISATRTDDAAALFYFEEIAKEKDKKAALKKYSEMYKEENCSALNAAKNGFLDNIIEPQFSRQYLIAALKIFISK